MFSRSLSRILLYLACLVAFNACLAFFCEPSEFNSFTCFFILFFRLDVIVRELSNSMSEISEKGMIMESDGQSDDTQQMMTY